jgi:hypothetical protein
VKGDLKSKSFPVKALKQVDEPMTLEKLVLAAISKREDQ